LSIIKTKCLCVWESKLTLTENIRPFDSIQKSLSPTPLPLGCRSFTFRVSDEDIEIEALQRVVNTLKKNPNNDLTQTTTLQCLTSMDFISCHIWEEDPLVLVGHNYHYLSFFFQVFWWPFVHGNRHWKHPLETRKKRMVFNVLLRF
jgi:hypothetical protein